MQGGARSRFDLCCDLDKTGGSTEDEVEAGDSEPRDDCSGTGSVCIQGETTRLGLVVQGRYDSLRDRFDGQAWVAIPVLKELAKCGARCEGHSVWCLSMGCAILVSWQWAIQQSRLLRLLGLLCQLCLLKEKWINSI